MSDVNANGLFMNYLLSALYRKVIVPNDFHSQAIAVKEIMRNDISGLVDSITDFKVSSASVSYHIKTDNDNLNKILAKWLHSINVEYNGKLPSGIKALATEYFKERWKGSSFPILKIIAWKEIDGFMVPSKMAFIEGGSVYSKAITNDKTYVDLVGYDYYIGRKRDEASKLDKNCIITKPYCRWYDEYPVPYLIKNGVYYNWKMIQSLKDKQAQVLDQILPYLLTIKKNTENLAISKSVNYDDDKLKKVAGQMEEIIQRMNDFQFDGQRKSKTPLRVSQFDEEIEHLMPDLTIVMKKELFEVFDRSILSGLGLIDIADATSSSRKESILNPKGFVQEVKTGVEDFKQILREVVILIQQKNESKIKYVNADFRVISSPITGFMSDLFKQTMRSLYDRGLISKKLAVEIIGETNYEYEVEQRKHESKEGQEYFMFPPVIQNIEQQGMEYPNNPPPQKGKKNKQKPGQDNVTTEDKINPVEKLNFKASVLIDGLVGSPYEAIADLPDQVKEVLKTPKQRRTWLQVFNRAFHFYQGKFGDAKKAETLAFKTAWAKAKQ